MSAKELGDSIRAHAARLQDSMLDLIKANTFPVEDKDGSSTYLTFSQLEERVGVELQEGSEESATYYVFGAKPGKLRERRYVTEC